jgi:hypothetical protein
MRNDGVDARKERIQAVVRKIVASLTANKDVGSISLDTIIADIQYEEGLTGKRIIEYAEVGEKRGLYILDKENNQIRRVTIS